MSGGGNREQVNLSIQKFNMADIQFPSTIKKDEPGKGPVVVIVGKRGTGKSFLINDLLYYHRSIPSGAVISGSEEGNGYYSRIVPKMFIHHEYNTAIIENVLKRQKQVMKQINRDFATYHKTTIDPRTFVILDDCMYDSKWTRDKVMRLIFMNGRHWHIMLIITLQYVMGIPPILRTQVDYVFILRENIIANRKRLYEQFAGMFPTFEAFCGVMDHCTNDYECLVIKNNSRSNHLFDQVFWYKAAPHENFRLGCRAFWERSAAMESDDEDEAGFDASKMRKKNALNLNVKKLN